MFHSTVFLEQRVSLEQLVLLEESVRGYLDSRRGCYASIRYSQGIKRAELLSTGFMRLLELFRNNSEDENVQIGVSVVVVFLIYHLIDSNSKMLSNRILSTILDETSPLSTLKSNFKNYYRLPWSQTEYDHFCQYYLQYPDHYPAYVSLRRRGLLIEEIQSCAVTANFFMRGARATISRSTFSNRDYAIKRLSPPYQRHRQCQKEFLKEINILISLQHDYILPCIFASRDPLYFVMDCIPLTLYGLFEQFDHGCSLSLTKPDDLLLKILSALNYLHNKRIMHGDLKPENILLQEKNGELIPRLIDFGLACYFGEKLAHPIGSPYYMSPEIWNASPSSPCVARSSVDIYAMSIMMLEIWTGRTMESRFKGVPVYSYKHKVLSGAVPAEIVPQNVASLLAQGWSQNPSERPSASDFLAKLKGSRVVS